VRDAWLVVRGGGKAAEFWTFSEDQAQLDEFYR